MLARIRLTGFEPFGEHDVNISESLANRLIGREMKVDLDPTPPFGLESRTVTLDFEGEILSVDAEGGRRSTEHLQGIDAIIHLGLKENATRIHIEICAVNECDFRTADNAGRQANEIPVIEGGLNLLHTTAHHPSFNLAFADSDEVVISEDCGRFVCNETYYHTLHGIETRGCEVRGRALPALFVHLPPGEILAIERQQEILLDIAARLVQKPTIQVVGGVIVDPQGRMLACRRASSEEMGGWWEFPGGKIEADESETSALARELREELGLDVVVGECLGRHGHDYGSMVVELAFFACQADGQELSLKVHDEVRWITEDQIAEIEWLPPDVTFAERLAEAGFQALRDSS
jgi:8-oxo-dGTP diphosphatase